MVEWLVLVVWVVYAKECREEEVAGEKGVD